jgi:hypothetical protein
MAQPLDASRAKVPMAGRCDDVAMSSSYEHIVSRGAHGVTINNVYERLVEADREIRFGSDGSRLIKTTQIGWSFFTDSNAQGGRRPTIHRPLKVCSRSLTRLARAV